MKKRSLSNLMLVAEWRYLQSIHEPPEFRNPDKLVRYFLPARRRWRLAWFVQKRLSSLRADPFYYYLVARTRYYDGVFLDSISNGVERIINVGCGSDTRAYRFEHFLKQKGVQVLECDRAEDISNKMLMAKQWGERDDIANMSIDLNDDAWPDFEQWLLTNNMAKTLVLMEGVSPYINLETFGLFLSLLAKRLSPGSRVAYDYKRCGIADDFGRVGRTQRPFRLPSVSEEVGAYHDNLGYRVVQWEQGSALTTRILPRLIGLDAPLFMEDDLIQLEVC